jgi:imidazole glycerol-phosphate synthase subunit HisF
MFRVISRLDIKSEHLIKGVQFEGLRKIGVPRNFAKKYFDAGIDEIVLLDAVASLYGRNHLGSLVEEVSEEVFVPITVGGGIRTLQDAKQLFLSGADKVAINSATFSDSNLVSQIADKYGKQAVVGSIQAKKMGNEWFCLSQQGREKTNKTVWNHLDYLVEAGAGEILITSVDRDGTQKGLDIELVNKIVKHTSLPVIASGGVGLLSDIIEAADVSNLSGVAIASALHFGKFEVSDIQLALNDHGIKVRMAKHSD